MSKERKSAVIRKPVIDEDALLRFVAAASSSPEGLSSGKTVSGEGDGSTVQLTIALKRDIYLALEREATRKSRTVEEQVRKVLTKHIGRD